MALTSVSDGTTADAADLEQYKNMLEGAAGSTMVWLLRCATSSNFTIRLADNAGAQKLSIVDSDGAEVASIDSDGALTATGFTFTNLDVPTSASPSQTTLGRMVWDTTNKVLTIGDGSGRDTVGSGDPLVMQVFS